MDRFFGQLHVHHFAEELRDEVCVRQCRFSRWFALMGGSECLLQAAENASRIVDQTVE